MSVHSEYDDRRIVNLFRDLSSNDSDHVQTSGESATEQLLPKQASLEGVPLEILLMILKSLSVVDGECLALCNHGIRWKLQGNMTRLRRKLQPAPNDYVYWKVFLRRISRDTPHYDYCEQHNSLHKCTGVGPPCRFTSFKPRCILRHGEVYSMPIYIGEIRRRPEFTLTFQHIQLAMRRQSHGPNEGIDLQSLSWTEVRTFNRPGATTLLSAEPQIVSGELYFRIQICVKAHPDADMVHTLVGRRFVDALAVCQRFMQKGINVITHLPLRLLNNSIGRCCSGCEKETESDRSTCEDGDSVTTVTKWLNFGKGIDPKDWNWRRHLSRTPQVSKMAEIDESIRNQRMFEQLADRSYKILEQENRSLLCNGRYRDTFQPCWTLSCCAGDESAHELWIRYKKPLKAALPLECICYGKMYRRVCTPCCRAFGSWKRANNLTANTATIL